MNPEEAVGATLEELCREVSANHDEERRRELICILCRCIEALGSLEEDERMRILEGLYPDRLRGSIDTAAGDLARFLERGSLHNLFHARHLLNWTEAEIRDRTNQPVTPPRNDNEPDSTTFDWEDC